MIKKHWPLIFSILMVIISIVLAIAAANSTDTGYVILAGLVIYLFLFPMTGAVIGGWYGWRIRSPMKWFLAPAVFLGASLFLLTADLISGSGSIEIDTYATVSLFTGAVCLAAEAASAAVSRLVRRSKEKRQ